MVHHPVLNYPIHGLCEVYSGGIDRSGKTGIGTDVGVRVDFQYPGFYGVVHAEIDPGISSQSEYLPAL